MTEPTNIYNVLVVEDNPDDQVLASRFLAESKIFRLDHAELLAEAMQKAERKSYDLMLLDLNLPDSEGLSTFFDLHRKFPRTPIVVWTGLEERSWAVQALQEGAQDYLIKSQITQMVLQQSLRYAIARQRSQRLLETGGKVLRTSLDRLGTAMIVLKADGKVEWLNSAAEALIDQPLQDIQGQALANVVAIRLGDKPLWNPDNLPRQAEEVRMNCWWEVSVQRQQPNATVQTMMMAAIPLKGILSEQLYLLALESKENWSVLEYTNSSNDSAQPSDSLHLTPREVEVLRLIAEGFSNKEIAVQLDISARTVESHRRHLMQKFDVHDVVSLIRMAVQSNFIKIS